MRIKAIVGAALLALGVSMGAAAESPGSAAEGTVFEQFPEAVGVYVNSLEVYGLSYQQWTGKVGYQIVAGGNYQPQMTMGNLFQYSVQAGLMYSLYREDFSSWFSGGLFLVGLLGHQGRRDYTVDANGSKDEYGIPNSYVLGPYQPALIGGAGIGFEAVLFRHFSTELQFMYTGRAFSNPGISFGFGWAGRYRF